MYELYSTYGLPVDITAILAQEVGLQVDMDSVAKARQKSSQDSKGTWKKPLEKSSLVSNQEENPQDDSHRVPPPVQLLEWEARGIVTKFTGMENLLEVSFNELMHSRLQFDERGIEDFGSTC